MSSAAVSPTHSADFINLGDESQALEVVASSVLSLWKVVNNLTRLRPTTRRHLRRMVEGPGRKG